MQAFYLAKSGRPGPVLVDVPKDIQQQLAVPEFEQPMAIDGYISRLPQEPVQRQVDAVIQALREVSWLLKFLGQDRRFIRCQNRWVAKIPLTFPLHPA